MSQVMKFLNIAEINGCESKRVKKLNMIWISKKVLSETPNDFSL